MTATTPTLSIDNRVQQLLAQMSVEEKIGQMTQIDFSVVSVENGQDAEQAVDMDKLKQALFTYHVGSILNAPSTPNNRAQPLEKWRRMTQTIRDMAAPVSPPTPGPAQTLSELAEQLQTQAIGGVTDWESSELVAFARQLGLGHS
jgi:hypothetical protein